MNSAQTLAAGFVQALCVATHYTLYQSRQGAVARNAAGRRSEHANGTTVGAVAPVSRSSVGSLDDASAAPRCGGWRRLLTSVLPMQSVPANVSAVTSPAPAVDAGLLGLVLLAQFHGIAADMEQLRDSMKQLFEQALQK